MTASPAVSGPNVNGPPVGGDRPPVVVLIHGQPGSAKDWSAVVPLLAERFHVISFDRPGYGENPAPASGFWANAAAVIDVMDKVQARQAILVGHSWGGGVALAATMHFPQRVAGLVLVASVSPTERISRSDRFLALQPFGGAMTAAAFAAAGAVLTLPPVHALATRRLPLGARHVLAGLSQGDHRRTARSFAVEQRALIDELPGLAPGLAGIDVATRVITGDSDHVVAPAASGRLAAGITGAELVRVAGAGHLLPLDRPDAVAEAVGDVAGLLGIRKGDRPKR